LPRRMGTKKVGEAEIRQKSGSMADLNNDQRDHRKFFARSDLGVKTYLLRAKESWRM